MLLINLAISQQLFSFSYLSHLTARQAVLEPCGPFKLASYRRDQFLSAKNEKRMGWDSNPGYPHGYSSFQDCRLRPLGHPSNHVPLPAPAGLLFIALKIYRC